MSKGKSRLLISVSLLVASLPAYCFGDENKIEPSIEVREEYDDNIFLTGSDEMEDFISTLRPGLVLSKKSERLNASLKSYLNLIAYSDHDELNAVDHDYKGDFSFLPTETTKIGASANYLKDSRPDRDLEVTGEVLSTNIRERQRYDLSGEWNITEISGIGASYSYFEDDYDNIETSSYYANVAGLGYSHNLNKYFANTTGRLNFSYGKYEFSSSSVDNYTMTAGFERNLSEVWQFSLGAGPRYTRTEYEAAVAPKDDDWGLSAQAALTYKGETSTAKFSASHEVDASSGRNGTVERTTLRADADRRFTEELRGGLGLSYYRNKTDTDTTILRVDEHNYRLQPRLTYDFTTDLFAELSYAFIFIDDKDNNVERERNQVFLRLQKKFSLLD